MCDYGRLNYKWVHREDRLSQVQTPKSKAEGRPGTWGVALSEIAGLLSRAATGSAAIIASARQTNEELYLLKKLADKLGAATDSIPRSGASDKLLLNADRNPNAQGVRLTGICTAALGGGLRKSAQAIEQGTVRTLLVFGEDVVKHGLVPGLLGKLETLIVSDILPNETTKLAHYLLPGCAHVEKRGTFTNTKGRVQKFMKAVEPPGDARPDGSFCTSWSRVSRARPETRTWKLCSTAWPRKCRRSAD